MKIKQFSQQGKRSNNEDCLGITKGLLTVCDGMGGHNFGERASAFVKEAMVQAFVSPRPLNKMDIQQQLNKVQTDLNKLLETEPELEKMGTTFTGVFITPDVWYAAHIGDSRIYLFRPSEKKLWHTWDHSLVGELMRTKEITVEAGRFHPMSNRIAKAIIAKRDGKISSASIVKIDQLKKGDIFLLCSDGVVEGWGDYELVQLFSDKSLTFDQKCQKLSQQCNAKSKDNNTAIIAEIEDGDVINYGKNDELDWTTFAEVEADYKKYLKDNSDEEEEEPKPAANTATTPPPGFIDQTPNEEPTPNYSTTSKRKGINRGLLIAIAAVAIVAACILLRPKDPDTKAFEACKTVNDYRHYIAGFGFNGKHYNEAKHFVDSVVNDSIDKAKELLRIQEDDAYYHCTTYLACKQYLDNYPDGRYVSEVKQRMEVLAKVEEEENAFAECTTIDGCKAYLSKYQEGRYVEVVQAKKTELEEDEAYKNCTNIANCDRYLAKYPDGRYVAKVYEKKAEIMAEAVAKQEEADFKKCKNNIKACEQYLKEYPEGPHVDEVKQIKAELEQKAAEEKANQEKKEDEINKVETQQVETPDVKIDSALNNNKKEPKVFNLTKTSDVEPVKFTVNDDVTFEMESKDGQHYKSKTPVSQALWIAVMGVEKAPKTWNLENGNAPAIGVKGRDRSTFRTKLNSKLDQDFDLTPDSPEGFYLQFTKKK